MYADVDLRKDDIIEINGFRLITFFHTMNIGNGYYVINKTNKKELPGNKYGGYFGINDVKIVIKSNENTVFQFSAAPLDFYNNSNPYITISTCVTNESGFIQPGVYSFSIPTYCESTSIYVDSDGSVKKGSGGFSRLFYFGPGMSSKFSGSILDYRNNRESEILKVGSNPNLFSDPMILFPSPEISLIGSDELNVVRFAITHNFPSITINGTNDMVFYTETEGSALFSGEKSQVCGTEEGKMKIELSEGYSSSWITAVFRPNTTVKHTNALVLGGNNNVKIDNTIHRFDIVVFIKTTSFKTSSPIKPFYFASNSWPAAVFLPENASLTIETSDKNLPVFTAYVRPDGKASYCNNTNGVLPTPLWAGVTLLKKLTLYETLSKIIVVNGSCTVKTELRTFENDGLIAYYSKKPISINTEKDDIIVAALQNAYKKNILIAGN